MATPAADITPNMDQEPPNLPENPHWAQQQA